MTIAVYVSVSDIITDKVEFKRLYRTVQDVWRWASGVVPNTTRRRNCLSTSEFFILRKSRGRVTIGWDCLGSMPFLILLEGGVMRTWFCRILPFGVKILLLIHSGSTKIHRRESLQFPRKSPLFSLTDTCNFNSSLRDISGRKNKNISSLTMVDR